MKSVCLTLVDGTTSNMFHLNHKLCEKMMSKECKPLDINFKQRDQLSLDVKASVIVISHRFRVIVVAHEGQLHIIDLDTKALKKSKSVEDIIYHMVLEETNGDEYLITLSHSTICKHRVSELLNGRSEMWKFRSDLFANSYRGITLQCTNSENLLYVCDVFRSCIDVIRASDGVLLTTFGNKFGNICHSFNLKPAEITTPYQWPRSKMEIWPLHHSTIFSLSHIETTSCLSNDPLIEPSMILKLLVQSLLIHPTKILLLRIVKTWILFNMALSAVQRA